MSSRILLVEDEPGLVLTLSDLLASEGYEVETASDGPSGLARALAGSFDLIILDVMLPGRNGFDVCRDLRQNGTDTAILMLTARTQITDRVVGLKLGADDYLTKPFDPAELLARIEALLRRVNKTNLTPVVRFQFDDVQVDFERGDVLKGESPVALASKELQLLRYLVDNRDKVISREELLRNVWEYQASVSSRTVDVHMAWLRQKLEANPQMPRHFHTVRGVGYKFTA
jgi:two-component system, OmpR family, alkaline phosphatase synthesis response regulator PhoP